MASGQLSQTCIMFGHMDQLLVSMVEAWLRSEKATEVDIQ